MGKQSSKENTANLFNRYVWLVDLIYRTGHITFEEINERWNHSLLNENGENIPLRTFHNHRKAIEEMFDISIECDKRNGYSYYIENYDDVKRGGLRKWLINIFTVKNLINESHKLYHRILFEQVPSGQQFLIPIIEAMRDGVKIEMTYQNYWHPEPHTIEVSPYCIKIFRQRWYLIAHNEFNDKIRIYSLDRMHSICATKSKFKLPEEFDSEVYFANCYGIIHQGNPEFVSVKVLNRERKNCYFKSLPLHHSQEIVEQNDEYTIFKYYLQPTFDFRQELLSHGAEIEVLSPQWFREEIINIIEEQRKNYIK